jgi:peptidoglycan/LPS O-acetylase OafA/YrhL
LLNHRQHFNSLDGIRGIAILMVFCHHLCPVNGNPVAILCSTLWIGVDLFFVLSGFLITGVLYDTLQQPGFFRKFYARRALRLLPIYIVVVALIMIAGVALGSHPTSWTLPYFVYGSNIIRELGLPDGIAPSIDASHFWSLAVEEQFYLLWPLALFFAKTRRRIFALCLAGSFLSVILRWFAVGHTGTFFLGTPYFELPMRLDSLLLGGALAMMLRGRETAGLLTSERLHCLLIAGIAGLVYTFGVAGHGSMFGPDVVRYGYLSAAITFVALIGLTLRNNSWATHLGNIPLLQMFGRCSYGLYLIHLVPRHWYYAALSAAQSHCANALEFNAVSAAIFFAYLALCLGVATLSYSTLELYFLRMKINFRYRDERRPTPVEGRILATAILAS